MQDTHDILGRINKSKRKQLVAFIREKDGGDEEAVIIPAGSRDDLPKDNRHDKGTLAIILLGFSPWSDKRGFWILIDELAQDGKEKLTKYYKSCADVAELVGSPSEAPAQKKAGRKRRILTDEEKKHIDELRAQGVGIAKIARELKTSNRLIMQYYQNELVTDRD